MDAHLQSADYSDEDYIDMEVGSQTNVFCHSKSSPTHPREFEFQMFSSSSERDTITSPADELFYKGKLLPLHLPPRLQMVEKLLQNPSTYDSKMNKTDTCEGSFSTPLFTTTANTPTANTPFQSCNISPAESCQVSRELHPDEYIYDYLAEASSPACDQDPGKFWTRRLKLIKQSTIGSKLKASRAYIKSFFNKSGCSDKSSAEALQNVKEGSISKADKSSAAALKNVNEGSISKADKCGNKYAIVAVKTRFGQIQKGGYQISSSVQRSFKKEDNVDNGKGRHRRSFSGVSGAIKRLSSSRYSSSVSPSGASASSSNTSNGFQEMQFFKRSISANLEVENPIQAAIAHCKRSQQPFRPRKTVSDLGICSLSASRIIHEDQERPGLCRG